MEKIGHLTLGSILGILLIILTHYFFGWFIFNLLNIVIMLTVIYVYSLLPDIDIKSGTIVWTFFGVGLLAVVIGYTTKNNPYMLIGIILLAVTFLSATFFTHRGYTHSIMFSLLVSVPLIFFHWNYAVLAAVCYYSHLIADGEPFKLL